MTFTPTMSFRSILPRIQTRRESVQASRSGDASDVLRRYFKKTRPATHGELLAAIARDW